MPQLSEQVKISLENADRSLRDALSFSSKVEDPSINIAISQIIHAVQQVSKYYEKPKNPWEEAMRRHLEGM